MKNIKTKKSIIWDWNGTLLNDAELALFSINVMLKKRFLPTLSLPEYKQVFSFPVKDYYLRIGFDFEKESWDAAANEFIELYYQNLSNYGLHPNTREVLQYFHNQNYFQVIVSASEQEVLRKAVEDFGIQKYFNHITGIENHYADSKLFNAQNLMKQYKLNPKEVWLVGDTLHDFDVAEKLGCQCILVSQGHQSRERLRQSKAIVVENLENVISIIE